MTFTDDVVGNAGFAPALDGDEREVQRISSAAETTAKRKQALYELLAALEAPLAELECLDAFTRMPGFNSGTEATVDEPGGTDNVPINPDHSNDPDP